MSTECGTNAYHSDCACEDCNNIILNSLNYSCVSHCVQLFVLMFEQTVEPMKTNHVFCFFRWLRTHVSCVKGGKYVKMCPVERCAMRRCYC